MKFIATKENLIEHLGLGNQFHSWLYYTPYDRRGLLFDFSMLKSENRILCYNGLTKKVTHEIVNEFTLDEFISEYHDDIFYSTAHYRVEWTNLGYSWNN